MIKPAARSDPSTSFRPDDADQDQREKPIRSGAALSPSATMPASAFVDHLVFGADSERLRGVTRHVARVSALGVAPRAHREALTRGIASS